MHQRARRFVERTEETYGFTPEVLEFPEGTKTAADAADAVGCDVAQIASSIVLTVGRDADAADAGDGDGGDEQVVVVTSGANRVDEERVADLVGAEAARTADAGEVKAATGWSIGGVPPICHENELRTFFDETLLDHEVVYAAAGTPQTVFAADPADLCERADAEPADVAEE